MRAPAHAAFGLCLGNVVASFYADNPDIEFGLNGLTGAALFAVLFGSLSPDIDSRHSCISKVLPWLYGLIRKRWGHREAVHSGIGIIVAMGLFWALALFVYFVFQQQGRPLGENRSWMLSMLFSTGFTSHLLLDTWTKTGIRWTWPSWDRWVLPPGERYRARSGNWQVELPIIMVSLLVFWWMIPKTQKGAVASVRDGIGRFEGLRKAYLEMPNREMVVTFKGFFENDKSSVSGRGLVLAEEGSYLVIYFDGQVHHLGEDQGNIRLLDGEIDALDQPPQVRIIPPYLNTSLSDILADMSAGGYAGQILISGELHADQPFAVNRPYDEWTFSVTAKSLKMSFAQVADIRALGVRPADTGPLVSELEQEMVKLKAREDSLLAARGQTPILSALYKRDLLLKLIKAVQKEREKLEKEIEKKGNAASTIRFSGPLAVQVMPGFAEATQGRPKF